MNNLVKKAFGEVYRMLCEQHAALPSPATRRAEECRARLARRLAGEDVQTLQALLEALDEERDALCADAFGEGFTLGARLMTDLLTE